MRESDPYRQVFRPGAPLEDRYFYFGREAELQLIERHMESPGTHPLILGTRGVGKTSLAHQAFVENGRRAAFITVDAFTTFAHFAAFVLEALDRRAGGARGGADASARAARMTPWDLYQTLRDAPDRWVLVIDEYETVVDSETDLNPALVALIKKLADNSRECDHRLVIVGIDDGCEALFREHDSIERSVKRVSVPPMPCAALSIFLSRAERKLGFLFAPGVKEAIILDSGGAPYFVHLVALRSVETMLDRHPDDRVVTATDYFAGLGAALETGFQRDRERLTREIDRVDGRTAIVMRELVLLGGSQGTDRERLLAAVHANGGMTEDEAQATLRHMMLGGTLIETTENGRLRPAHPMLAALARHRFSGPDQLPVGLEKQLDLI